MITTCLDESEGDFSENGLSRPSSPHSIRVKEGVNDFYDFYDRRIKWEGRWGSKPQ
jgi:hypothetical protein